MYRCTGLQPYSKRENVSAAVLKVLQERSRVSPAIRGRAPQTRGLRQIRRCRVSVPHFKSWLAGVIVRCDYSQLSDYSSKSNL